MTMPQVTVSSGLRHYVELLLKREAAIFQKWIDYVIRTSKPKTEDTYPRSIESPPRDVPRTGAFHQGRHTYEA